MINRSLFYCLAGALTTFQCAALTAKESDLYELKAVTVDAKKMLKDKQEVGSTTKVISDKTIENYNLKTFEEAASLVPNLHVLSPSSLSDSTMISLRGVTPTMEGEQKIASLTDGIYSHTFDVNLLDIEKIKVLFGPQGSVYGPNSESGVVNLISKDPKPFFESELGLGYGNYNTREITAIVNDRLDDQGVLSYRTALNATYSNGYFERTYDDKKDVNKIQDYNGRFKLRFMPESIPLDIINSIDVQQKRNSINQFARIESIDKGKKYTSGDYAGDSDADIYRDAIKVNYQLEDMSFTSISAYTYENKNDSHDLDFTPTPFSALFYDRKLNYFSQELRLNSNDNEKFSWLAGVYYFQQKEKLNVDFGLSGIGSDTRDLTTKTKNQAFFASTSYKFNKKLEWVAGIRYDHESKDYNYVESGLITNRLVGDLSDSAWLPRVGLNYYQDDSKMWYVSISQGYKAGGFNGIAPRAAQIDNPNYDKETSTNYEVGFKSSWLYNSLRWNVDLFWIDYKDQQIEQLSFPESVIQNADRSVSRGFETDLIWGFSRHLSVFANIGYTDSYFKKYQDSTYNNTGVTTGSLDYKDNRPAFSPRFTYSLGAGYHFTQGYFIYGNYNGTGPMYFDNANTQKQSGYGTFNLHLGYKNKDYTVSLWGKNLLDKNYNNYAFVLNEINTGQQNWYARAGEPRTFGVSVKVLLGE